MAGAILLIVIGVVFLLTNLGVLDWDVWRSIWRLWPIILIAVGLDLMFGRRRILGGLLAALLLMVVVVPVILWLGSDPGSQKTETISQSLKDARQARIELDLGVARLDLGSPAEPGKLLEGTARLAEKEYLEQSFELEGDTAVLRLQHRRKGFSFFSFGKRAPTWNLRLTNQVPIKLHIDTGVGTSELNLQDLKITDLDIDTGVGQTVLILPRAGDVRASVSGGVGETIVRIPGTMAAEIRATSGIGSVDIRGLFERDGDTYRSPEYHTATNRVELHVDGGVGSILIERIEITEPVQPEEVPPAEVPAESPGTGNPPTR